MMEDKLERRVLTISRLWNNPQIQTTVNIEGIELTISLDDFIEAIIQEIGPVTWTFKDATFRAKVSQAVNRVVQGIKEESAKVI